jgi:hypothetical protein
MFEEEEWKEKRTLSQINEVKVTNLAARLPIDESRARQLFGIQPGFPTACLSMSSISFDILNPTSSDKQL